MSEGRLSWLDGWRGIACLFMLVYHLLFDFYMFGWMRWSTLMSWPLVLMQKYICYSFILCAGISATLSRSILRHGVVTLAAGGLVTIVSFVMDEPILFGVLQFLGVAMVLYAFVGRWVERVPEQIAPVLWLALFVGTHILTDHVQAEDSWFAWLGAFTSRPERFTRGLFWLGFQYRGFFSADYFPVLPYIFLFFLGSWLGQELRRYRERLDCLYASKAPRALTWIGSHTMVIYLLHQPVLYGACWLVYRLTGA